MRFAHGVLWKWLPSRRSDATSIFLVLIALPWVSAQPPPPGPHEESGDGDEVSHDHHDHGRGGGFLEEKLLILAIGLALGGALFIFLLRWWKIRAEKRKILMRSDTEIEVLPLGEAAKSVPKYWTGFRESKNDTRAKATEDLAFDELHYAPHEDMKFFQDMLNKTYKDIVTRDRKCPTQTHGSTAGGCPCVQKDGDPGLPTGYQLLRAIRVEDSAMFRRYTERRERIKQCWEGCEPLEPTTLTRQAIESYTKSWLPMWIWSKEPPIAELDHSLNEVYLWHGTPVRQGLAIAQDDFKISLAGSGNASMFGEGLYFAESCTKADEYARDDTGHYSDVRALLLCRVCMGRIHYTTEPEPDALQKFLDGERDSTLADLAASRNTFREFVVYDAQQVYPEYVLLYKRLHQSETPEPLPKELPFLLELPLYWKNVCENPHSPGFREHWLVKEKIRELIERLANGTSSLGGPYTVAKVMRVEDCKLWLRYMETKHQLTLEAQKTRFPPPNELDGMPRSGHSLTGSIVQEFHGDEAISVETMSPGLNELLLWHGTSEWGAKGIASKGFRVGQAKHGRRFGDGVYLAEDLAKSLAYCNRGANGHRYVLLCRALCGNMYYTESYGLDSIVREDAHSILAYPERNSPREFIVFNESHVYPEYTIEFQ